MTLSPATVGTAEKPVEPPGAAAAPRSGRRKSSRSRSQARAAYLFLAPWFIGLFVITLGPMIASLYLSFTDYSLLSNSHWVGFDNYDKMFTQDDRFISSLKVTTIYVVVSVPLQLAFALGLALVLDKGLRGLSIYRSIFYLPSLLGGSVAISILWRKIFGVDGIVNSLLGLFGYDGQGWVTSPDTALWTLIILHVWTFGAPMVIFLAGLRQIPQNLYEAASVDGAGRARQFFHITLPHLKDAIVLSTLLRGVWEFNNVDLLYTLTGGGPAGQTTTLPLYVANTGINGHDFGYASALTTVAFVILLFCSILYLRLSKFGGDTK
jgi:multiple sugar transport system permease protein